MNPKVSIIYLSYNSMPYFDKVVSSWKELDYTRERLEIIIVDNASADGSVDYIRENILPFSGDSLPKITFLPCERNHGFAGGNNIGISHAILNGADYVYLQNNDAYFDSKAIKEAVAVSEADNKIGSVQSLLLLWQNPELVNSTGGAVHFLGFGYARDYKRCTADLNLTANREIAYASGTAVLLRADLLKQIGALEESYFMYHEDLELGWRIRLAGYKNILAPKSVVYHKYEFSRSIKKFFWMERNRLITHLIHLKLGTLVLIFPAMMIMELALIYAGIRQGWIKEKLLSYVDIINPLTLKNIFKLRKRSKELRRVSDAEIIRLFTSKVLHQEEDSPLVLYVMNPMFTFYWVIVKKLIYW